MAPNCRIDQHEQRHEEHRHHNDRAVELPIFESLENTILLNIRVTWILIHTYFRKQMRDDVHVWNAQVFREEFITHDFDRIGTAKQQNYCKEITTQGAYMIQIADSMSDVSSANAMKMNR